MFLGKLLKDRINLQSHPSHLQQVLCVVHTVDADVVLQRGAVGGSEQQQFQAFSGGHAEGLPHQSKATQLLGEDPTRLRLQLTVEGL